MAVSKKQQACVARYSAKNYDQFLVRVKKGRKDEIQAHAEARGESVNGFVSRAIAETMGRDSGEASLTQLQTPPGQPAEDGGIPLPPDMLEAAQAAAEAAGETLTEFIARAVSETAERDRLSRDH